MLKVMRQMPTQVGRVSVAQGETKRDLASDETCGPRHETQDPGTTPKQYAHAGRTIKSLTLRCC